MSAGENKTAAVGQDHGGEVNQATPGYPTRSPESITDDLRRGVDVEEQLAWLSRHIDALDLRAASEESLVAFRTLLGQMMGKIDIERQRRDREDFRKAMDQGVFDPVYLTKPWERAR